MVEASYDVHEAVQILTLVPIPLHYHVLLHNRLVCDVPQVYGEARGTRLCIRCIAASSHVDFPIRHKAYAEVS